MPPASNYEQFTAAVAEAYPRLPKQLQRIAQFVLEHPDDLAFGTIATIAESAQVQPSAMIRFANSLNFGGFTEIQLLYRARMLQRSGSYRERIGAMLQSEPEEPSESSVLHQFVSDGMADLARLQENVNQRDLTTAAKAICKARRVHGLGQRRAFPVACYLAYALGELEIHAHLVDGVGGMLPGSLRQINTDDILIVTSFKHYSRDVIDAASATHGRGVPVLAITDFALSPLKPHATVCFEVGRGPDAPFGSLVSPLCLAQALVVSAGQHLVDPGRKGRAQAARKPTTQRKPANVGARA